MLVRVQGRTGHAFAADMSLLVFLVNFGSKPFLQAQPTEWNFSPEFSPMAAETLNVSDGTTMQITRLPDIDDETWAEVKDYVEKNPDTAKALQNFAKNPEAMRGWLQTQAG